MHIRNIGVSVLSLAMVCAACGSAFALNPVGPGEFVAAETSADMSLAGQSLAVPANAATTNFPGVFCPRGEVNATYPEGSPIGVWQTVWRNVSLSDVQGFTARLSYCSDNIGTSNTATYVWTFLNKYLIPAGFVDAGVYHVTDNEDGSKSCQFQRETGLSNIFMGFKVTFKQEGADVKARIDLCRYAYKSDVQQLGGDFTMFGGTLRIAKVPFRESSGCIADIGCILKDGVNPVLAPTSINFVNTDTTAVADEELTNVVRRYDACLELPWVKLWPNTRLADVDVGAARMIGTGSGGNWVTAYAYLPEPVLGGEVVRYRYQYYLSSYVRTANVYLRQVGEDVWARVLSVRHNYSTEGLPNSCDTANSNGDGEYVSITNDLAGAVTEHPVSGKQIQTLKFQTATRPGKVQHTVTVDGGFNPRFVPLRLFETKLAIAPASGETVTLGSPIYGYAGAIAGTGAGTVALNVDLPQFFNLESASGRVRVSGRRTIGGELSVTSGAELEFPFASGAASSVTATSASFAPGARIVLSSGSDARLIAPDSVFTLVSGCGLSSSDIDGVSATCEGGMQRFRPRLSVNAGGDLVVTLFDAKGMILFVQ